MAKVVSRRRTHSGSLGLESHVVSSNPNDKTLLAKSNSCAPPVQPSQCTHRRQTSHPVQSVASKESGGVSSSKAAELLVSTMLENSQMIKTKGHRRSHSYGHHKGFHEKENYHQRHRRTGSSVIETLQTLACTGAEQDNPNNSIAQFLENLRKEQAEK